MLLASKAVGGVGEQPLGGPWLSLSAGCMCLDDLAVGYWRPGCQRREELIILLGCALFHTISNPLVYDSIEVVFNSPVYGKDPKKLLLEVKWL